MLVSDLAGSSVAGPGLSAPGVPPHLQVVLGSEARTDVILQMLVSLLRLLFVVRKARSWWRRAPTAARGQRSATRRWLPICPRRIVRHQMQCLGGGVSRLPLLTKQMHDLICTAPLIVSARPPLRSSEPVYVADRCFGDWGIVGIANGVGVRSELKAMACGGNAKSGFKRARHREK